MKKSIKSKKNPSSSSLQKLLEQSNELSFRDLQKSLEQSNKQSLSILQELSEESDEPDDDFTFSDSQESSEESDKPDDDFTFSDSQESSEESDKPDDDFTFSDSQKSSEESDKPDDYFAFEQSNNEDTKPSQNYETRDQSKQKENRNKATKTQNSELTLYKLRDFVGDGIVWKHLVTITSKKFMQEIHETLSATKKNAQKKILINIDFIFFQILKLTYYYVAIGKNENNLVKFNIHYYLTLLTEAISNLSIHGADHTERAYTLYDKMLQLENEVKKLLDNPSFKLPNNIKKKLDKILHFLEINFLANDRILNCIYQYYKDAKLQPDESESSNQPKNIYQRLNMLFEKIRKLKSEYAEHDFTNLILDETSTSNLKIFETPPSKKNKLSTIDYHTTTPQSTPNRIDDEVENAAKYIVPTITDITKEIDKANTKQTNNIRSKNNMNIEEQLQIEVDTKVGLGYEDSSENKDPEEHNQEVKNRTQRRKLNF